jgi:hypothetical protein
MGRIRVDPGMTLSAIEQLQALPEKLDYLNPANGETTENIISQANDSFDKMASLWQKGHYPQIVEYANGLPLYCICDIRICVYYLYSLWTTTPNITTENIINTLTTLLTHTQQPWLATIDQKNEKTLGKIFFNSTSLFFRKILIRIKKPRPPHKAKDKSPANVLQSLDNFKLAIKDLRPEMREDLSNLLRSLIDYFSALQAEEQKKQELQQSTQNIDATEKNTSIEDNELETGSVVPLNRKSENTSLDPNIFNPSYPLQLLFRRIQVLHKLIEKQQDLKAASVLKDIQTELDNFNPLLYFPEYFTSFAALRASNASNLEPFFYEQDSYQWQVLVEYYKTHMQAFLGSDKDNDPLKAQPPSLTDGTVASAQTSTFDSKTLLPSGEDYTDDDYDA